MLIRDLTTIPNDVALDDHLAVLRVYVPQLQEAMRLRDWQVVVEIVAQAGSNGDGYAEIEVIEGRRLARLSVAYEHFKTEPAVQRHTLAHELLHLYLNRVLEAAWAAKEHLAPAAFEIYYRHLKNRLEEGVDATADAMAPHLPLPPTPAQARLAVNGQQRQPARSR
jgi:hypothetical protein